MLTLFLTLTALCLTVCAICVVRALQRVNPRSRRGYVALRLIAGLGAFVNAVVAWDAWVV